MQRWLIQIIMLSLLLFVTACGKPSGTDSHDNHSKTHNDHEAMKNHDKPMIHTQWSIKKPKANQSSSLTIRVTDHQGKPIPDFKTNHTKKMHLIVVKSDLSSFQHLHPQYQGEGTFDISVPFSEGGKYKFIADFVPKDGEQSIQTHWVNVQGKSKPTQPLKKEKRWVKKVDNNEVSLTLEKPIRANQEQMLTFHFKDTQTKKEITNLQPYLGAIGHVVIISEGAKDYLHVHPMDEKGTGPNAMFHTTFPKKGAYKVWGEFKRNGKEFTVPFVLNVL
ncbi:hypothetical protein [Marininema halotolerans]|uniref:YtkA-like n=1 Tax=Marininema halotolerans TaxID=1155944 RepID=A0A1I6R8Z2_9BACL|nr:hypothetical protein [Marininema halotolerans]SFS61171.1 hypothetical protein SAMN05444972_104280 [Marininema halotolerans]